MDCLLIFAPACFSAGTGNGERKNDDGFAGIMHADIQYKLLRIARKDKTTMNRRIIAIIVLGLVLLASLMACGYFGVKTIRRTRLRRAAMTAYEKKEYPLAERLLLQYVQKDPNAEAEYVALANIYHEFGNAGMEAQMWQTASSLNPLKEEYYKNMLASAVKSASYEALHSILGRKFKMNEKLSDQELYLYVISSYRSDYQKDCDEAYKKAIEADPEAFQKSDLGQMAEFMFKYDNLSEAERSEYLNRAVESEDPTIRFEALYMEINRIIQRSEGTENDEEIERLLKLAAETNYYEGTPLLVDFYFSRYRFDDAITTAEPFFNSIDDLTMFLMYAESCAYLEKTESIRSLKEIVHKKMNILSTLDEYCDILIAYLEKDEKKLSSVVRKSGLLFSSPLTRYIRLQVAIANGSFNEIRTVAQEIFSTPPFHDLHDRSFLACMDYISEEMKKKENQDDPSQMAELAKILSGYIQDNRLLTDIILTDQYKKGLVKEADLLNALEQFPDDILLIRTALEYLIFNGKPEQAMAIIEPIMETAEAEEQDPGSDFRFLYMLALNQLGQHDKAAVIFRDLVEQSEFDLGLLGQYFQFCVENNREADLQSMADNLATVKDGKLEHYGVFFHAAALLVTEDEAKEKEALDLLASTPTGDPEFTFYAANRLSEHDRLDEAEAKYKAILKTYSNPFLIDVNLSELYDARGEKEKALEAAKEAFEKEKESMLPTFIYAKRLSEAKRYEEAVSILNFPRHAVNYREDVVELWTDCMHHVIETSIADQRYMQAEEQCKHLLLIVPDDEFGKENLEKVRKLMKQQKNGAQDKTAAPAA